MPTKPQTHSVARPRPDREHAVYDRRWGVFSRRFRLRHPACAVCGRFASQVDHIVPIADGGRMYDESNLQSLCTSCHSKKTVAQTGFGK